MVNQGPFTLFISDLHLGAGRPDIQSCALDFLSREASHATALYILGDLFDYWLGDDALTTESRAIMAALRRLSEGGVGVYFMPGNRDFLIENAFAQASGCQILADPTVINLYGTPTLLMHGDSLCTDDIAYQRARARLRRPAILRAYLFLPVFLRRAIARHLRRKSKVHTQRQAAVLMDVNQKAVETVFQVYGVKRLIHGHTHRPAVHHFSVNSHSLQRIVLGDWDHGKSVLTCTEDGLHLFAPQRHRFQEQAMN